MHSGDKDGQGRLSVHDQIKANPYCIVDMDEQMQTPDICLAAVQQNPLTLRHVHRQTPDICLAAVRQDGHMLEHVEQQTDAICQAAVEETGYAFRYVKAPNEALCLKAVDNEPYMLCLVPSELYTLEVYLTAVRRSTAIISQFPWPHDALMDPSSGQMAQWVAIFQACQNLGEFTRIKIMHPMLDTLPLGKQYTDEWSQPVGSDRVLLDTLVEMASELTRLCPANALVEAFAHEVHVQQEHALNRQLRAAASVTPPPVDNPTLTGL